MSVLRDMVQQRQDRQARRAASAPRVRALKAIGYTVLLVVVLTLLAVANFPILQAYVPTPLITWFHRFFQRF